MSLLVLRARISDSAHYFYQLFLRRSHVVSLNLFEIFLLLILAEANSLLHGLRVIIKSMVHEALLLIILLDGGESIDIDMGLYHWVNFTLNLLDTLSIYDYWEPFMDSLLVLREHILVVWFQNTFEMWGVSVILRSIDRKVISYRLIHLLLYLPSGCVGRTINLRFSDAESILNTLRNGC